MLVGNTLAERQQLFNHFETSLLTRFPELELTVRNLGWSGDTPALQPRPLNFGDAATAPDGAARRRDPGVLRPQRIVRGRGRRRRLRAATSRPGSRSIARRATTASRRRGSCWCRRSRTSGWRGSSHVDVEARNRELARYTEAMRSLAGSTRRAVRRRLHADADGDGRLAGAADDQRHPPERDRR